MTDVTTGRYYNFRHKVLNLNGESFYSETFKVWTCELPSAPTKPTWIISSETSINIEWVAPSDVGGCPLREYQLFRDDGDSSETPSVQVMESETTQLYYLH
jgi:hypothetical protein